MRFFMPRWAVPVIAVLGLLAASCGGGSSADVADGGETAEPTAAVEATAEPEPTATAEPEPTPEPTPQPEPTPEPTAEPAPTPEPEAANPLLIETSLGSVQGDIREADGVSIRSWRALPFAADPSGENRWRPPMPHDGYDGVFDGTGEGLRCPQQGGGVTAAFLVGPEQAEDCLTLSVWSPEDAVDLPVMVWIHGGGFSSGSAHDLLYEGTDFAANGVVLVNINYRLGALGFLASPEMGAEDADGRFGNYGILDQMAALQWVQANVANFGGDPSNVTVFGESAGGFAICALMASPAAEGLFHKALMQSSDGCRVFVSAEDAAATADEFTAEVGCDSLECLRELPVDELLISSGPSSLVRDGVTLDVPALEQAAAGELNDIPVLLGSNSDEFTLFTIGAPEPTDAELIAQIDEVLGEAPITAAELVALYQGPEFTTNLERFQAIARDGVFGCSSQLFAETLAEAGGQAWSYRYSYVSDQDPFGIGAAHGVEMVFVFNNPEGISILGIDELDATGTQVSASMQEAWTSFAAAGSPVAPIDWPVTDVADSQIADIGSEWTLIDQLSDGRCPVWFNALGN